MFNSPQQSDLERLHRVKQRGAPMADALGPELLSFFKHSVQKRQTKLNSIAAIWERLVPEQLLEHCALEGYHAGTLKVIVDSSSHLYELRQLLLAGLQRQILLACRSSGLRKITLKFGRWYEGNGRDRKITF
jgi:Dna[CI] antecedent, DciA